MSHRAVILAAAGAAGAAAFGGWGVALRAADPTPATTRAAATRAVAASTQATTAATTRAVASAATAPAAAAPATRPAPDPRIEAAIRKLSSESWKERQAAQDTLVRFGQQAVPYLRDLGRSDDDEVRTRAGAALWQIEQNDQLGGSVITIKVKDAKPQDVFAEIGRQARAEFATAPPNLWAVNRGAGAAGAAGAAKTLTLDLDRVPFWTAFREACKLSGVFPQQMGMERRMTLMQGSGGQWNGPSVISGPFLVVANRIYRSDSIDLANPGAVQREFYVQMAAFAEPKVRVIQSSYNVRLDEAVDDRGNSLLDRNGNRYGDGMSSGQQWMWNLTARMAYPDNPGKRVARLRGGMRFVVQTKAETLEITDILSARNLTKTAAGRRVMVKDVKKNGDMYEVQMTIYRGTLSQAEWNAVSYPGYAIRMLDKDNRPLTSHGWGGGGGGSEMNYNWTFGRGNWGGNANDKVGEPYRLVWEIPTETREMTADFEFKDLPMP